MGSVTRLYVRHLNPPRIVLCDLRDDLVSAWTQQLDPGKTPWINIYHGEFGDLASEVDAIVIPITCAGIMGRVFVECFGEALQKKLLARIRRKYHGKMSVGQAVILSTQSRFFPYIICTPIVQVTMVPGKETTTAYLATRAVFDLWQLGRFERRLIRRMIKSIALPGLGMSTDQISVDACAKQQFKASKEAFSFLRDANKHRLFFCTDRPRNL